MDSLDEVLELIAPDRLTIIFLAVCTCGNRDDDA